MSDDLIILDDFDVTGHREGCDCRTDVTAQTCAPELFRIARGLQVVTEANIELLGPMSGDHVLVLSGITFAEDEDAGRYMLDLIRELVEARGVTAGAAADHMPVVVTTEHPDGIKLLDEDEMRAAGWVRAEPKGDT